MQQTQGWAVASRQTGRHATVQGRTWTRKAVQHGALMCRSEPKKKWGKLNNMLKGWLRARAGGNRIRLQNAHLYTRQSNAATATPGQAGASQPSLVLLAHPTSGGRPTTAAAATTAQPCVRQLALELVVFRQQPAETQYKGRAVGGVGWGVGCGVWGVGCSVQLPLELVMLRWQLAKTQYNTPEQCNTPKI